MDGEVRALVAEAEAAEAAGDLGAALGNLEKAVAAADAQQKKKGAGAREQQQDALQDALYAKLSLASLAVRANLHGMQPEELKRVDAMLKWCCGATKVADEAQLSAAHGLRGVLLSRAMGDFENAVQAFEESLRLNDKNCDSLYCYATILDEVFQEKDEAAELYSRVLALQPDNVAVMNNFATILIEKAPQVGPSERGPLLQQAKTLLRRAQDEAPGFPAYNLACIAAQEAATCGDDTAQRASVAQECRSWLVVAQQTGGIPDAGILEEDEDLAGVREEPWFAKVVMQAKHPTCFVIPFAGNYVLLREPEGGVCSDTDGQHGSTEANGTDEREVFMDQEDGDVHMDQAKDNKCQDMEGTTGWTIWDASYVTLRYLEADLQGNPPAGYPALSGGAGPEWWKGKRVLDLSAGLGLLGIACAKLGANVVLTDIGAKQVATMQVNVALNGLSSDQVVCAPLAWGDTQTFADLQARYGPFDLVLASDLLYIGVRDSLLESLGATLVQAVRHSAETSVLIMCYEERQARSERAFLEDLKKAVTCEHTKVEAPELLRDIRERDQGNLASALAGLTIHEDPDIVLVALRAAAPTAE